MTWLISKALMRDFENSHCLQGQGGGILGGHLLGWRTVCAVEFGEYPASVLCQRQNDGILPPFPIWDDVCTFDGKPWRGLVDVVSGGFPCQDISIAGAGAGLDGERSGLWTEMARIIGEVRPRFAFIENSPMLTIRGLDRVLCDLAALGYDAEWGCLSAGETGAPHDRDRVWIVAAEIPDADSQGLQGRKVGRSNGGNRTESGNQQLAGLPRQHWPAWPDEPGIPRVVNGVAAYAHRSKATGNGQVPRVAAAAFDILARRLTA